jgi:hypothetical protein
MRVATGKSCTLPARNQYANLENVIVETYPRHGVITPQAGSGLVYRPQPAFVGADFFAVELRGRTGTEAGAMKLQVNVTVQ